MAQAVAAVATGSEENARRAATDVGICCSPGCGVVLQNRRECPICKEMNIPGSYFCSRDCYKKNWQKHKKIHQKKATATDSAENSDAKPGSSSSKDGEGSSKAPSKTPSKEVEQNAAAAKVICVIPGDAEVSLVTLMSDYPLKAYGDYAKEKNELKADLGWNSIGEVKFYPKTGCQFYFFGYHDKDAKRKKEPLNKAVSRAAGVDVYGRCLVLPSGPVGNESFYEGVKIRFVDLAETLAFYRDKDPRLIFQEREASRAVGPAMLMNGGMGGQAGYMGGMAGYQTNVTKGNSRLHFYSRY